MPVKVVAGRAVTAIGGLSGKRLHVVQRAGLDEDVAGVRAQLESAVAFALSAALHGELTPQQGCR